MQLDPSASNQPSGECGSDQNTHSAPPGNPSLDVGSLELDRRAILTLGISSVVHGPSGVAGVALESLAPTPLQVSPAALEKTSRFAACIRRAVQAGKELTAANRKVQGDRDDQKLLADWKKTPLYIIDGENSSRLHLGPKPTCLIERSIEDEIQRVKNYSQSVALAEPKLREFTDALQHLAGDELLAELLRECRTRVPEINQRYKDSIIDELKSIAALAQTSHGMEGQEFLGNCIKTIRELPIVDDELLIDSDDWKDLKDAVYRQIFDREGVLHASALDVQEKLKNSFVKLRDCVYRTSEFIVQVESEVLRQVGLDSSTPAMQGCLSDFGTNSLFDLLFGAISSFRGILPSNRSPFLDDGSGPSLLSLLESPQSYCDERLALWSVGPRELQDWLTHLESISHVPDFDRFQPTNEATDNGPRTDEPPAQTPCEEQESVPQRSGRFRAMVIRPRMQEDQAADLDQIAPSLLGSLDEFGTARFSVQLTECLVGERNWEIPSGFKHEDTLAVVRILSGRSGAIVWQPRFSTNSSLALAVGDVAIISLRGLRSLSFQSSDDTADDVSFELAICQGDS
jgi:hypothetical protein